MKTLVEFVTKNKIKKELIESIDLGLSSGTLWCNVNLGAKNENDAGNYYQWGNPEPLIVDKDNTDNYKKIDIISWRGKISPVNKELNNDWEIPSHKQIEELLNETTQNFTKDGIIIKGSNGNEIFLPYGGQFVGNGLDSVGEAGMIWCSDCVYVDRNYCYFFSEDLECNHLDESICKWGFNIRPVVRKK